MAQIFGGVALIIYIISFYKFNIKKVSINKE